MTSPIAALALAALAVLASACSATGSAPSAVALTTLCAGPVADPGVAPEGVVRTQAGWRALWQRLDGSGAEAPSVDFARQMVVYVARPDGAVEIERVVSEGGFLRVEVRAGTGAGYHAVRLPKSEAPVQFAR